VQNTLSAAVLATPQLDRLRQRREVSPIGGHAAQAEFYQSLPSVVTTFHLPTRTMAMTDETRELSYAEVAAMPNLPYPVIRICQDSYQSGLLFCKTEIIAKRLMNVPLFQWSLKTIRQKDGKVAYLSNVSGKHLCLEIEELLQRLRDSRHHRYLEKVLSRQVRRANDFSADYKEFIVIATPCKSDVPPGALRLSEMIRRIPQLHAVRSHLRKLPSGNMTTVRSHTRGRGEAAQFKDYIMR